MGIEDRHPSPANQDTQLWKDLGINPMVVSTPVYQIGAALVDQARNAQKHLGALHKFGFIEGYDEAFRERASARRKISIFTHVAINVQHQLEGMTRDDINPASYLDIIASACESPSRSVESTPHYSDKDRQELRELIGTLCFAYWQDNTVLSILPPEQ